MRVEEGNRKKWDFRFWERWMRKLFSAWIWHIAMINGSMICRLLRTQDPCCCHFSWNSWTIYSIVWTAEKKFRRYWNPTYEKVATAVCELFRRQETDFYQKRIFKFLARWVRHIRVFWKVIKDGVQECNKRLGLTILWIVNS